MSAQPRPRVWLVNVEGTLVPSGCRIDERMRQWLLAFAREHDLRLTSECDHEDVLAMLGPELLKAVTVCYANRGNSVWARGQQLHSLKFDPPALLLPYLRELVKQSLYPLEFEPDVVRHQGMVRLRMLGARPRLDEAVSFKDWDDAYQERRSWSRAIASAFPKLSAMPHGHHCIDVYPLGCDRSQVLDHIRGPVLVIGDVHNHSSCDLQLATKAAERGDGSRVFSSLRWDTTHALLESLRHGGDKPHPSELTLP